MSLYATAKRGENHYAAKLTNDDVRHIRALVEERRALAKRLSALSNRSIAEKFDVTTSCIERVIYGQTWTHIT